MKIHIQIKLSIKRRYKSFEIKIEYPNITNFQIDRELIKGHKVTFITDSRDKLRIAQQYLTT